MLRLSPRSLARGSTAVTVAVAMIAGAVADPAGLGILPADPENGMADPIDRVEIGP